MTRYYTLYGVQLAEVVFEFSTNIITKVINEIVQAQEYVRIAMFQIHHEKVFEALMGKAKQGTKIEILTLPYDSINDDVRNEVEERFEALKAQGVTIYFNKWNVGSSERTTTATNRWYSFHGKFIVTDKSAIILSANFTKSQELDAVLIFRNDKDKVREFYQQYNRLLNLFVSNEAGFNGTIHRKILEALHGKDDGVFKLPKGADPIHQQHWIQHYPIILCPSAKLNEGKLYFTPFDCRGRDIFSSFIEEANEVYISTESFTDERFSKFLLRVATNKKIPIKILTEPSSMDFNDKINRMLRDLSLPRY